MNRTVHTRFASFAQTHSLRMLMLLATLLLGSIAVMAQSTAFSYQGRLNDGANAANGTYEIQFKLFDAVTGGTQVGATFIPTPAGVVVTNGAFTVTLDFGATAFPGANRWLEISVKPPNGAAFTTLTPRQRVTATPYAIKSLSADGLSAACNGCVTGTQIGSLPATSGNYIQNGVALQAGSNFNISGNGLIGGNVGIGTTTPPQRRLHVSGTGSDDAGVGDLLVSGTGAVGSAITLAAGSGGRRYSWISTGSAVASSVGSLAAYDVDSSEYRMVINRLGDVGIGTITPTRKLTVIANGQGISQISGSVEVGTYVNEFAGWIQTFSNHPLRFATNNNSIPQMTLATSGNLGIGTQTPTRAKLEVVGAFGNTVVATGWGLFPTGTATAGPFAGPFGVYSDGGMFSPTFIAFSDERIKRIHGQSDAARDLATLTGIKVTDYSYIDTMTNGTGRQKKVIAQQVEEIFPQAVKRSTDVVPDIYQKAAFKDGWVTLANSLKQGERVRLIGLDKGVKDGVYEVLEAEPSRFRTAFTAQGAEVFVYGREVKDFRSVDYEAISMLNVSATQELKRLMEQKDVEIKAIKAESLALRAENESLNERLAALEQFVQQLKGQSENQQPKQQSKQQ
ncbi:MAG: tail fiber domain-containing protein [Blastocatellia bacterium]